jgi:molybdopterin molybdotransferase
MISFDEAFERVRSAAVPLGTEEVFLDEAAGRLLAAPVEARIDGPRFDVSTMDGYAVRDSDLPALPARLPVAGESFPGAPRPAELPEGACVRIFTGAALPAGADRVVIQEEVVREGGDARFCGPLASERYIRRKASDFAAGDVLVRPGRKLGPRALVAAAAADVDRVEVYRRPRVVIIGTGDELRRPGTAALTEAAVPESLSVGLSALAVECGAVVAGRRLLPDDLAAMKAEAASCLAGADVIVVTGGASVGERDFARSMFERLELLFSRVAIKPGKPVWLGRAGGRLVVGLPGNPTSALVTARLLLRPLLEGLGGGDPDSSLSWRRAPIAFPMEQAGDRETFWRARNEGGRVVLESNQDSGSQMTLAEADLLVRRRPGAEALEPGVEVDVVDF